MGYTRGVYFLERLRQFLRRAERHELPAAPGGRAALSESARTAVRSALREKAARLPEAEAERLLEAWNAEFVTRFVDGFLRKVQGSVVIDPSDGAEVERALDAGLRAALALPLPVDGGPVVRAAARLGVELADELGQEEELSDERPITHDHLAEYCFQNRLLGSGGSDLTPAGRVFLAQPGREGVRWLLALEGVQSLAPEDPWRLHPRAAAHLLEHPFGEGVLFAWHDVEGADALRAWPWRWETIVRLEGMGLVSITERICTLDEPDGYRAYEVTPLGLELLPEVAAAADTSVRTMARTLVEDDAARRLGTTTGIPLPNRPAGTEAVVRQARLVAHEVRNALVPVRIAAETLYKRARTAGDDEGLRKLRDRIDGGLGRVLDFAEEMLRAAALAEVGPAAFDPLGALRDALAAVRPDAAPTTRIDARLPPTLPRIVGPRERFTLAVTNLLRNAVQVSNGRGGTVTLEARVADGAAEIRVADDGPGIPGELRDLIFRPGFTSKTRGTGFGLALAREVVEAEMNGTIEYRDGALFVPVQSRPTHRAGVRRQRGGAAARRCEGAPRAAGAGRRQRRRGTAVSRSARSTCGCSCGSSGRRRSGGRSG